MQSPDMLSLRTKGECFSFQPV
uniref:Uncharacterized protein n=1 Tax=Anguilla anguilla TaxID=7936 RepID=A0A0E9P7U9_ANGAN